MCKTSTKSPSFHKIENNLEGALKSTNIAERKVNKAINNLKDEIRSINMAKRRALPLLLLAIPIVMVQIIMEIIISIVLRISPFKNNPDISSTIPGTRPLPNRKSYVGDLVGYIPFLNNVTNHWWLLHKEQGGSDLPDGDPVRVANFGHPCVTVMDVKSSEAVIDMDHRKFGNLQCPYKSFLESTMSNIYRKGERAVIFRRFLASIVPKSEQDDQFKIAVEGMKSEAKAWIDTHPGPDQDKKDFVDHCVTGFNSTLILGAPIPHEIVDAAKDGSMFLQFPRFLPGFLLPPYHAMKKARGYLHKYIKASPRWQSILWAAAEAGLTPSEACDGIISIFCFNGQGLADSFHVALDFLPLFDYGKEMMNDEKALESYAWETLRFNGPFGIKTTEQDTIIETSKGDKYGVKKGTNLCVSYECVNLDNSVWPGAESFKADRYLTSDSTTVKSNPWPITTFAMPLGSIHDFKRNAKTHSCVIGAYGHRIMTSFISMMADPQFEYTLPGFEGTGHINNMREYIHNRAEKIEFKKYKIIK